MIRSPSLLALGLLMMLGALAFGAVLHHDGEVGLADDFGQAQAGDDLRFKGELVPFIPPIVAHGWGPILDALANHTYLLAQEDPALLILATASEQQAVAETLVVEATVLVNIEHPTHPDRRIVLIEVDGATSPLVFG